MSMSRGMLGAGGGFSSARHGSTSAIPTIGDKASYFPLTIKWEEGPSSFFIDLSDFKSYSDTTTKFKEVFDEYHEKNKYQHDEFFWMKIDDVCFKFQFISYDEFRWSYDTLFIKTIYINRPNPGLNELDKSLEGIDWIKIMKTLIAVIRSVIDTAPVLGFIGETDRAVERFFGGCNIAWNRDPTGVEILKRLKSAYDEIKQTQEFKNLISTFDAGISLVNQAGMKIVRGQHL
jgi:hypothetical protein